MLEDDKSARRCNQVLIVLRYGFIYLLLDLFSSFKVGLPELSGPLGQEIEHISISKREVYRFYLFVLSERFYFFFRSVSKI